MNATTNETDARCDHVRFDQAWRGFRASADELGRACGHAVRGAVHKDPIAEPYSPGLAAVLSFVVPGLGQAYNGQVLKGCLFLIGFFLLIPWALAVMDAYYTARVKNLEARLDAHQLAY